VDGSDFYLLVNITSCVCVHTIASSQGYESQDYDLEGCDVEQPGTGRNFRKELLLPFLEYTEDTEGEAG
jgi:hypothetical protein